MSGLLAFGLFVFAAPTAAHDELSRRTGWRHAQTPRVGPRPANQFVGLGDDLIRISGWIPTELGDLAALAQLRAMGDTGEAYALVGGDGAVYGAFVLEDLDETQKVLLQDGVPLRTDFQLSFRRIADQDARAAATPQGAVAGAAGASGDAGATWLYGDSPEAIAAVDRLNGGGSTQAELDAADRAAGAATAQELAAANRAALGGG